MNAMNDPSNFDLSQATDILRRTPAVLAALLHGVDDTWARATEGRARPYRRPFGRCRRRQASGLILLRVHPRLDPLRKDPRYWPMVEQMGLADSALDTWARGDRGDQR
jgi:hypothetical protein